MARPHPRQFAILLAAAPLVVALVLASGGQSVAPPSGLEHARAAFSVPSATLRADRLSRAAVTWRGGPITTSTGETVAVLVSDSLPLEITPEGWAEFFAGLTHGSELSQLTAYIATLDEVQEVCGERALGCYGQNQMLAPGEATPQGPTAEEIVRHEYGHHVAMHRVNPPWAAIDWGPKHWASAANVCARVSRSEAFPGDQGSNYFRNPGEAWAEVYRLMDERKAGIATASWEIISPSFFPDATALTAAERDVLEPWTATRTTLYTRTVGKRRVWWIPLQTPLDGGLRLSATLPRGATHDVSLVAGNRRTVVGRAQWVGQRVRRFEGSVCGQRSLFVRVTQRGVLGRIRISVTTP